MKYSLKCFSVLLATMVLTSCEFDDTEIWESMHQMQQELDETQEQVQATQAELELLSALVDALNQGKLIVEVTPIAGGYELLLNDGSKLVIRDGEAGQDGEDGLDGEDGDSFFQAVEVDQERGVVVITLADGNQITLPLYREPEVRTLTFEDEDAKFSPFTVSGLDIATWSDLIDDQYGGAMLYNDYATTDYRWHDGGNTELMSQLNDNGPYWSGGHAVSNYYMEEYATADYTTQLAVSCGAEGAAGHNGSANFCVHNGYVDEHSWKQVMASFAFQDGVERVVDHMYVVATSYFLRSVELGDGFNQPATEESWVKVVAYGYDGSGNLTGNSEFYLVSPGREFLTEWSRWELAGLGKVQRIAFNIEASEDQVGSYGMNCPGYFAYDDVAVIFE